MDKVKVFMLIGIIGISLILATYYINNNQPPTANTYAIYHDLKEDGVPKEKIRKLGLTTVENVIQDTLIQFAKEKIKEASKDLCDPNLNHSFSDAYELCCVNVLDKSEFEATPVGRVVEVDEHDTTTYSQKIHPFVSDILENATLLITSGEAELQNLLKTNLEANGVTVNSTSVNISQPTRIGGVVTSETITYTGIFKINTSQEEKDLCPSDKDAQGNWISESPYQHMMKAAENIGCKDILCDEIISTDYCTGVYTCESVSNYGSNTKFWYRITHFICDINNTNYRRALAFHPECIPTNFTMLTEGGSSIYFENFPLNKEAIKKCAKDRGTITCYDANGNPIPCSEVGLNTENQKNKKTLHLAHKLSVTVSYELTSTVHSLVLYKVTSQERIPVSITVNGVNYYYILTLTKGQISPELVAQKGGGSCIQTFRVREKIIISVTDAAGNEITSDEITPSIYYTEAFASTSCSNEIFTSDNLCVG